MLCQVAGVECCLSVVLQFPSVNNQSRETMESYEGMGISPFMYTQNSLSITVGMCCTVQLLA